MTTPLIFFGSDKYSAIVLRAIILSGDSRKVVVVTDRKTGGTDVEKLAIAHNLKVTYYPDIEPSLITKNTLGLCASFDHLLPDKIIQLFAGKLYNLHPSLLPQYRNVSPVQYALALGDHETGITLFRISTGIDNGEIIAQIEEPIQKEDTTPTLTSRLFTKGAELFLSYDLCNPINNYKDRNFVIPTKNPIFTHRLTRNSGFIEWPILHKLLANQPISPSDTKNELLSLRLGSDPHDTQLLHDLIRALTPWPGVWSNVPTKKGDLRISLTSHTGYVIPDILINGKPKPISYSDFTKYYLNV